MTALTKAQLRDNDSSGGSNIDSYKTHWIAHLKWVHFVLYKSYPNNVALKK